MRHLEKVMPNPSSPATVETSPAKSNNYIMNDFATEIKVEFPNLMLETCDNFMKSEFASDEDTGGLRLDNDEDDNNSISSSDERYDPKTYVRRNKRKSHLPQRAVMQLELSQSGSLGNSSESSQDLSENLRIDFNNIHADGVSGSVGAGIDNNMLLSDNDEDNNGFEMLPGDEDLLANIKTSDIFKDLQDEADGEKLDDEILDNVKEEWKAHWGVKCNMCEQVFPYRTEFDRHYRDSYSLHPVYTCSFCNKTAEKYSTFRSHCYRHITEGRYKCKECPKGFSLQSMLHVHILAKHTKSKPYVCEECGRSFVTKPGLKIHIKKHKTELREDYPCVECGKILHTRGGLTSHMNVHRLGRRFMCDVCGKTFTQKVNMQQHVKQHTGDKPHECDKCGKTFAERSHLARHYSFHSDKRPFKCDVCQKMYKTERCLKVHSLVHAAARPFVCDYCKKGFLSSTKLKQHYNIHTGERPYKCKYCERTFTNYPNWLKHTRRRHKVDHKTGVNLDSKIILPKVEIDSLTSLSSPSIVQQKQQQPSHIELHPAAIVDTSEQLVADITFSRTEELLLQQGLLNFPITTDDKFMIPQQIDLLTGSNNSSMGLLVPYFQAPLTNQSLMQQHSASTIPIQFSDLIHNQYLHQPLSCD